MTPPNPRSGRTLNSSPFSTFETVHTTASVRPARTCASASHDTSTSSSANGASTRVDAEIDTPTSASLPSRTTTTRSGACSDVRRDHRRFLRLVGEDMPDELGVAGVDVVDAIAAAAIPAEAPAQGGVADELSQVVRQRVRRRAPTVRRRSRRCHGGISLPREHREVAHRMLVQRAREQSMERSRLRSTVPRQTGREPVPVARCWRRHPATRRRAAPPS